MSQNYLHVRKSWTDLRPISKQLQDWKYRKSVTLSRASGIVTNYQMKLVVGESAITGNDLVSNGGFDSNYTGWTGNNASLDVVAGGQSGNCLQMTRTGGNDQNAQQTGISVIPGKKYRLTGYVKSGTSGDEYRGGIYADDGTTALGGDYVTTSSSWQQVSFTFISTKTPIRIYCYKLTATSGTMLFDSITLFEVPDVDCSGLCLSTFNDLRFTKADGISLLDYWIESVSGSTGSKIATVWIEFDSIQTSNTTFYMYYGNSRAEAYSNGDNTFLFFEHFDSYPFDTNKLTVSSAAITASNSIVTVPSANGAKYIASKTTFNPGTMFEASIKGQGSNCSAEIGFMSWLGFEGSSIGTARGYADSGTATYTATTTPIPTTEYKVWGTHWKDTGNASFYVNRMLFDSIVSVQVPDSNLVASIGNWTAQANCSVYCDWVLVRQCLSTEPVWGTWGTQERGDYFLPPARRDALNMKPVSLQGVWK